MRHAIVGAAIFPPHIRVLVDRLRRYRSLLRLTTDPYLTIKIQIRIKQLEELLRKLGFDPDGSSRSLRRLRLRSRRHFLSPIRARPVRARAIDCY